MKTKLLSLFIFFSSIEAFAANSPDVFSIGRVDHQLHFTASYALSLTTTSFLMKRGVSQRKALLISNLSTLAIGLAKESLYDNRFEKGDMIANGLGVLTQSLFVIYF